MGLCGRAVTGAECGGIGVVRRNCPYPLGVMSSLPCLVASGLARVYPGSQLLRTRPNQCAPSRPNQCAPSVAKREKSAAQALLAANLKGSRIGIRSEGFGSL